MVRAPAVGPYSGKGSTDSSYEQNRFAHSGAWSLFTITLLLLDGASITDTDSSSCRRNSLKLRETACKQTVNL